VNRPEVWPIWVLPLPFDPVVHRKLPLDPAGGVLGGVAVVAEGVGTNGAEPLQPARRTTNRVPDTLSNFRISHPDFGTVAD
jgi:hypothetical protein